MTSRQIMTKNYKIDTEVFSGTDKMKEYGAIGRAVVRISCDGELIVELRDIYIRESKTGSKFVAYPSQKDKAGKKNDAGKDVYYPYYKLFPNDKETFDRLSAHIISKLEAGQCTPAPTASTPKQAPKLSQPKPMATPSVTGTEEFNFT